MGKCKVSCFKWKYLPFFKKTSEIFLENTAFANAATVFFSFLRIESRKRDAASG